VEACRVQRLKKNNVGANLRLREEDFLLSFDTPRSPTGGLRFVRVHIELGGFAERSEHEIGRNSSGFALLSIRLDEAQLESLQSALRAAFIEQGPADFRVDPNGHFRTLQFRDGARVLVVRSEYLGGVPDPEAPAVNAAWRLLEGLFEASIEA
jgi:hypothetical protein